MVKRTRKEFREYNVYHDRPFGLKWGTAFAMDELVTGIHANQYAALKNHAGLPEMKRSEIDVLLIEAYRYHYPLSIQLHLKDHFGRYLDNLTGFFAGRADESCFWLNEQKIMWEDVRHIACIDYEKWFVVHLKNEERQLTGKAVELTEILAAKNSRQPAAAAGIIYEKDESYQPFPDEIAAIMKSNKDDPQRRQI